MLQTLVDEMRIMLELDHPCIVACHGVFYELGMFKIVMEFCDAGSLLVWHMRRRIHVWHMRRRIHVWHMRRRIHVAGSLLVSVLRAHYITHCNT